MTQQYLNGELSLQLGEACEEPDYAMGATLTSLRHRVEQATVSELPTLAAKALDAVDAACWAALAHGDLISFDRECLACARLHEFATCAGLIP